MTLKPPTKTFPKLVMKEWPDLVNREVVEVTKDHVLIRETWVAPKSLSDFTRVLEGVEGQKEAPLRKQESDHD